MRVVKAWRTTFDSITDLVFINDKDFRLVRVNKAFADAFKTKPEALIGKHCYEIVHGTKEHLPNCLYKVTIKTKKPATAEFSEPHMGIHLEVSVSPIFDDKGEVSGSVHIVKDITERRRAEETLQESEKHYRLLADNGADTIWTVDMNMRLTYMSPSITRLLGYSVKEAMVKRMEEVFTPTSFEVAMKALAEELATEKMEQKDPFRSRMLELELKRKDGSIVPVEIGYSFLRDADAQPVEILAITRDITEWRRMKQKLIELYEVEKRQREELEEEQKARGLFLNTLAHELRTPLTPLAVSAELLKDIVAYDPKCREYKLASLILNSTKTLVSRLEELLDLARFSIGAFTIKPEPLDIKALLEKVASQYQGLAEKKKQSLILDIPQSLPIIEADHSRLEQVLINLLSNAIKFNTEEGNITMRASIKGSELVVEVEDQGSGLSEEEQERVFKAYHRVEQDRQRFAGLGLGLAVSRQIVEAHEGKIWVVSQLGRGSTFSFSLPVKSEEPVS